MPSFLVLFVSSLFSKHCTCRCVVVGCLGVVMGLLLGVSSSVFESSEASDTSDDDLYIKIHF